MTTHYMDEAEVLCDRIAIMDEGKIIAIDIPKKLIKQLLERGFKKEEHVEQANLDDVFIDLTSKSIDTEDNYCIIDEFWCDLYYPNALLEYEYFLPVYL